MQARIAFLSVTSDGLPVFAVSDGIRFWCPNTIRAPRLSAHLHAAKYPSAYDPRHPVAEAPAQQHRSADPPINTP
ncbi:MAG TPA: hypothetical protein VKA48_03140 [Gammaproteobacteria bacterium]|nr:hypothetical protein [Gammaproteobacteria bacterium]